MTLSRTAIEALAYSHRTSPYGTEKRNGYWILVDRRTGEAASYPTTKRNAESEAITMNRAYQDALEECGE